MASPLESNEPLPHDEDENTVIPYLERIMRTVLGRVRVVGYIEGLSFLILLFIAMPLKYVWDMPEAVKYIGQAHGLLWVLYILLLLHAWGDKKLNAIWFAGGFIASALPFGPFIFDRKLSERE